MKNLMCVAVALAASVAQAQVTNGSFEQPNQGFRSVGAGQTYGGWTCTGPNDIEFVRTEVNGNLPLLEASGYDGQYWIDLCGVGQPSGIFQNVTTTPGQQYDISVAMAANVWGSAATFSMAIEWNNVVVGTFSHNTAGRNGANMGWTRRSVVVTGTGNDRLEFRALNALTARGPAIDDVQMVAVPTPGVLGAFGLAGLAMGRRRR